MGAKASYNRRKRRQAKQGRFKPRHALIGGRTGSKHFKNRRSRRLK